MAMAWAGRIVKRIFIQDTKYSIIYVGEIKHIYYYVAAAIAVLTCVARQLAQLFLYQG